MYRAVLKTQPDGKLAKLAAAGSEPAFEVIVHRYRRPLLGYCRSRLRLSDSRAEDVVQQAFMNAWGALRSGSEVRELRPWLYRITHNQAVTLMRAAGPDDVSLSDLVNGPAGPVDGEYYESTRPADRVYEDQARLRETLTAVAALPELQRQALLATAVDGLSYDQVADELDTSSDAVRGLVYRARNALRAGVAVVFPGPLVLWAANQSGQAVSSDSVQQWMSEAAVGGGSVGIGAAVTKGAVVLASSAAVVSGGVGAGLATHVFAPGGNPGQGQRPGAPGSTSAASAGGPAQHPSSGAGDRSSANGGGGAAPDRLAGASLAARHQATAGRVGQMLSVGRGAVRPIGAGPREGPRLTEGRPVTSGAAAPSLQSSPAAGAQIGTGLQSSTAAGAQPQTGTDVRSPAAAGAQPQTGTDARSPAPAGAQTEPETPSSSAAGARTGPATGSPQANPTTSQTAATGSGGSDEQIGADPTPQPPSASDETPGSGPNGAAGAGGVGGPGTGAGPTAANAPVAPGGATASATSPAAAGNG